VPSIDQRQTIAAPAEAVWGFLARPELISKWHKGYKQVSILSTKIGVVGTRRRVVDEAGRATIEEISQWLENLGYEYVMVEGRYRDYRGRLRLQPIPEGTIVNWTFEYHLRGILPRLGYRRRLEGLMSESLKALRKQVELSGVRIDPDKQERFAMRPAPNWEERAALAHKTSRQPIESVAPSAPRAAHVALPDVERAIVLDEDDASLLSAEATMPMSYTTTAPTPIALPRMAPPPPPTEATILRGGTPLPAPPDPSFVASLSGAEPPIADTKPRKPKGLEEALHTGAEHADPQALTVPVSLVAPPAAPPPASAPPLEVTQTYAMPAASPPVRLFAPDPPKILTERPVPPPTQHDDTGTTSVWEAFGLTPPSERNRETTEMLIATLQEGSGTTKTLRGVVKARGRRATIPVRRAATGDKRTMARRKRR